MRIIMFSWEYPPKSVGGLAQHVFHLSRALVRRGMEVHVITAGGPELPVREDVAGVNVHRVPPYSLTAPDFRTWILHLNLAMQEYAAGMINSQGKIDLVHAHDWLVAFAARGIKYIYRVPLVATIHATEYGRNHGLHNDNQRYISDVEWWLTFEAWRVIVCSEYMEQELRNFFQLPQDKLRVVPNGVDLADFDERPVDWGRKNQRRMIFFVGRLVREKGVQLLLEAMPKILSYYPDAKAVIAGKGPYEDYLRNRARELGVGHRVHFAGYIDDATRNQLYREASVAVFPSLYEPFGIVALEGMAARTPVVVADTGGLREIVNHGIDGLKCYTGSANSLADNIMTVFGDPDLARRMMENGYKKVRDEYSWDSIARQTSDVYWEVLDESRGAGWRPDYLTNSRIGALYDRIRNYGRYNVFGQRAH
ncbi:MAG: glycosyltransferase family 4 protein [Bacillota bacterium]